MGNYRFKLSDMIPNAWFYKLHKEINRSSNNTLPVAVAAAGSTKKKHHLLKHLSDHTPSPPPTQTQTQPNNNSPSSYHLARKSYYLPRSTSRPSSATVDSFTETHHHCSPDSSSSSSAAAASSILLFESSPELRLDRVLTPDTTTSLCEYGPSANDLVHNSSFLPNNKNRVDDMLDELELELPRILTKPATAVKLKDHRCIYSLRTSSSSSAHTTKSKTKSKTTSSSRSKKVQLHNYNNIRTTPRKLSLLSPGKKIRIRSPKIVQPRRISTSQLLSNNKTPLSDSFAIVKSSFDPHTDFRESMLEMIVEHNIKGSKDLEDLLACYLSLNADEYHHLIIKVFKQIWFDLTDIIN